MNQNIPNKFKAYPKIKICSNSFRNMLALVDDNGIYPLMVGKDETPRIWIYTKNKKNEKIVIVKDNIAELPTIKVNIYSSEKKITIYTSRNERILEINYKEETPVINSLDLRPIGYNIYGDKEKLQIGTHVLTNNLMGGDEVKPIIILNQ